MADGLNKDNCTVGYSPDKEVMIITVPIKKYFDDEENGSALLIGKLEEIKNFAINELRQMIIRKSQSGIAKVNGSMPINLKLQ